jgi:O-antigen/teichoic acid export membrane protein
MRIQKSITNIFYNVIFSLTNLLLGFYSRAIFLRELSLDQLGLMTLATNFIGMLSLMELGVSAAIGYALYKSLREKDYTKINELLTLIRKVYLIVGMLILIFGLALTPLFYYLVGDYNNSLEIFVTYLLFLISTVFSYLYSYKHVLVTSDQNAYIITRVMGIARIVKTVIQIAIITQFASLYLWIVIEVTFTMIAYILINISINKNYRWLEINFSLSIKELLKRHSSVVRDIKNIIIHKLSGTVSTQSDSVVISIIGTTSAVAFYSNYYLVVNGVTTLMSQFFGGFTASIGNLITEKDRKKTLNIFFQLLYLELFIGVSIFSTFLFLINDFIGVWLGKGYIFPMSVVIIISLNLLIQLSRRTVDFFKDGFGIFHDIYAPLMQLIINLVISLILGFMFGIIGVYLGTLLSSLPILWIWRPYILFKQGFKVSFLIYIKKFLAAIIAGGISLTIAYLITSSIVMDVNNYIDLIIEFLIYTCIMLSVYFSLMCISSSFRELIKRIVTLLIRRKGELKND